VYFVLKIEAAFLSDTSVLCWTFMASVAKYRNSNSLPSCGVGGHAVAQLVEALRYKPEGFGFDSR